MAPSDWLLLVIGVAVVYLIYDWVRHYLLKCPRCRGAGVLHSPNFPGKYRPCPRCGRKGEVRHGFGRKS